MFKFTQNNYIDSNQVNRKQRDLGQCVSFINCDVVRMDSVCPSVCLLTFKKNFSSYVVPLSSKVSATIVHYFIIRENK